ncbi:Amino acid transporter [Cetobacterium ceti]|uniref:Amino acid transporter n=1 Tax=Cetobacterium ceti TaxID=180163 RepID=A0A1T4LJL7_9FUSO|nr:amino acid permease [Cetobacterium ceti]SJZ54748.1 Amino acid transporter [Cetobacterium ceti]
MGLEKKLKFLDVYSIASGAMISSGIFILPGLAYGKAGPGMILSYVLSGLIAFIGIMAIVELTTAMPKTGGDYFFVNKTFGPMLGTISGILSWFAISLKASLAIFGISEVLGKIIFGQPTYLQMTGIGIITIIIFGILNIVGVDVASKFEVIIVMLLIFLIIVYVVVGFKTMKMENFIPFVRNFYTKETLTVGEKINSIIGVSAFVFISYGGLLQTATVGEEVINPKKNIPKGIIVSIISIVFLYGLLLLVTVGNTPNDSYLMNSLTPVADIAKIFMGDFGFYIIVIASMLAFISTGNAGIMAASRYPIALSRDGLLPKKIAKVHIKFKTPIYSIVITGIFIGVTQLFPLESLAKVASAVVLLAYVLTNLAVIILRESGVRNYQPTFKAPLYPWIQIGSIIVFTWFIFKLGAFPGIILICFILTGFIIYYKFGKNNKNKEYALLHLMLRITEGIELDHNLEEELRDIIHEREEIELDIFDELVKNAIILDIEEKKSIYDILDENFEIFSKNIGITKNRFIKLFIEREEKSTTIINTFTAIPHIVLNENDNFKLFIIRGKEGIFLKDKDENIHAIFLFIGCPRCSRVHLKSLATIAFLTGEDDFEERWLKAPNENYLRDMILLSKRKRWN